MNRSLNTIAVRCTALLFVLILGITGGTYAQTERRNNPDYPQSRRSDDCKDIKADIEEFEDYALTDFPKIKKEIRKARHYIVFPTYMRYFCFDESDHEDVVLAAIPHLEDAFEEAPESGYLHFLFGVVYFESHQLDKARTAFDSAWKLRRDFHAVFHYYYARVLHASNKFEEALKQYNWAQAKMEAYDPVSKEIERRITQCEYGLILEQNQREVEIQNAGTNINTPYAEYAAAVSGNDSVMYYTVRGPGPECSSDRKRKKSKKKTFVSMYLERTFRSEWEGSSWGCPEELPKPVNHRRYDVASSNTSYTGDTLYVYKRKYFRLRYGDDRGALYQTIRNSSSEKQDYTVGGEEVKNVKPEEWSEPVEVSITSSQEHEPHMAISPNGKMMVFASDRPGGEGGYDLYIAYADSNGGSFSGAVNMGPEINTNQDERSPFLDWDNQTLYFSSNGHNSFGGFDIFATKRLGGQWAPPQNLGIPLNSASDDIYFVKQKDLKHGFFTSSRAGGQGYLDIYGYEAEPEELEYKEREFLAFPTYSIPMDEPLVVKVRPDMLLASGEQPRGVSESAGLPEGDDAEAFDQIKDQVTSIGRIHFPFDQAIITQYSSGLLNNRYIPVLKEQDQFKIVLLGHTDPYGNDEYNIALSRRRVEAVRKFLVDAGIPNSRIKVFYYGEKYLLMENVANMQKNVINRRVEIFLY